ncbi:MAG: sugar transferase [Endozoicomonadaceae bacterium]|nr:sugar transferase [Endozoicomonadaceae bacterium]
MFLKRVFDLLFVVPGLILLSPVFLLIAFVIKLSSDGSILFKQVRVGQQGKLFYVLKFRTMVMNAEEKGAKVTIHGDPRITKAGHFLREYKLDELPQLINVLKGEMSLVGPRPEVPEYVSFYTDDIKKVILSVPPGITDRASIEFKDENKILAGSIDPIKDYQEKVLPIKLNYYTKYVQERSLWLDFRLIIATIYSILALPKFKG